MSWQPRQPDHFLSWRLAAEDVKRGDLLALLDAAKAEGKLRTANVLLSDLKQMPASPSPATSCSGIRWTRSASETSEALQWNGIACSRSARFASLLLLCPRPGLQTRFAAGVWLILFTGVRVGELLGAAWADAYQAPADLRSIGDQAGVKLGFVDLARRTWLTRDQGPGWSHVPLERLRTCAVQDAE